MYCVECGKDEKLYENVCKECFIRKTEFFTIPQVIKIAICSNCFAREKAKHWEDTGKSAEAGIKATLIETIKKYNGIRHSKFSIELVPKKTNIFHATISINAKFDDLEISDTLETEVRINYRMCGKCSRLSGNYFEAIIQVRGTNRKLDELELSKAEDIVVTTINSADSGEPNAFLTKSECIHGGIDFYIGSTNLAKQIGKKLSKTFAGNLKESSSLIGRKEGRDIFRTTCIIRVPEYKLGEFITQNDHVYKILKILQKKITCLNLNTGRIERFATVDLKSFSLLGGTELIYDAIVVVENPTEIQILDPENYNTIDLVKPVNFKPTGESVKIFKNQDIVLLIPNLVDEKSLKNAE